MDQYMNACPCNAIQNTRQFWRCSGARSLDAESRRMNEVIWWMKDNLPDVSSILSCVGIFSRSQETPGGRKGKLNQPLSPLSNSFSDPFLASIKYWSKKTKIKISVHQVKDFVNLDGKRARQKQLSSAIRHPSSVCISPLVRTGSEWMEDEFWHKIALSVHNNACRRSGTCDVHLEKFW